MARVKVCRLCGHHNGPDELFCAAADCGTSLADVSAVDSSEIERMAAEAELPRVGRELDLVRQYFEEQYGRGFEYACLFPGMNRVVQSAGRVIRSETDRGVIVLIGQRFGYENYMSLFPPDWYESSPAELVSRAYEAELARFWGGPQPAGDAGFVSPSPI